MYTIKLVLIPFTPAVLPLKVLALIQAVYLWKNHICMTGKVALRILMRDFSHNMLNQLIRSRAQKGKGLQYYGASGINHGMRYIKWLLNTGLFVDKIALIVESE